MYQVLTFSPEDHLASTCIKPFQTAGYGFVSADKCTDILEVVPILVNFIFYRLYEPIPGLHSTLGIVTRFDQQNVLPLPHRCSLEIGRASCRETLYSSAGAAAPQTKA